MNNKFYINFFFGNKQTKNINKFLILFSAMSKKVKHKRHCINTRHAPQAIGPYNQAVLIDGTLYISGQLGIDPGTMELVEGGVEEEAIQV